MVIDRLIICPAPKQKSAVWRVLSLTVADRIEAVVLRITELTGACRRDSGRFRLRMSISSTDHVVVPENEGTEDAPTVTFADLGLPEGVVRKLAQNGVTTPFPIQAATIPDALAGKDILGRGRTGSGKTLSFGLPTLAQLAGGHTEKKKPRAVILTPTRELAMQVADALQPYGDVLGLKVKVVCGGTSIGNQLYA